MPDLSRPFVPKHNATKLTEPSGFKLMTEERHAARHAELKARQEADEKAAEEARCFKANPVRSSHLASLGVHSVSKRPVTEAKPFALMSEAKHAVASMQWASRVEKELEEEKGKFASFQAKPVPAVVADGSKVYTPRRSSKPLTEVQNIELNVDRRMQKHQEISAHKAEREKALEAEKLAQQLRRKEQEEREVRQLRRSMVPHTPLLDTRIFPCAQTIIRTACIVLALVWHGFYRRCGNSCQTRFFWRICMS